MAFLEWLEAKLNPMELNPARWDDYYISQTITRLPEPGARSIPKARDEPKLYPGECMGLRGEPFGAELPFKSIMSDDLLKRSKFWMPVYAVGYNWLASNSVAAERLQGEINRITQHYNQGQFSCKQVVLVTHSMGGLVARACAQLPGMAETIVGVVHGVTHARHRRRSRLSPLQIGSARRKRARRLGHWKHRPGSHCCFGASPRRFTTVAHARLP
jgi:PGAP1-like protein